MNGTSTILTSHSKVRSDNEFHTIAKQVVPGGFTLGQKIRCYADRYYHSVINYNGKVYKCTLRMEKENGILHDNGMIKWDNRILTQLYSKATFDNNKCLGCKYLPLCLGPCSQNRTSFTCYYDLSEISIQDFIIESHKRQKRHAKQILETR